MRNFSRNFLLFCIIVLAFFLRIWRVSEIPPSLSWDEASIGYNAYSILKTGRDEHGRFLPYDAFAAFGDYKPPVAIYANVPFVAIFGLNELAVRLPSVISGTIAVLLTYFIIYELLKKTDVALLTSLLFSISPWHIQLSRAGFEANIGLTLLLTGVYMFLQSEKNPRLLVYWLLPFVAAIYTFNSARFTGPLLALGIICFGWRTVRKHFRLFVIGVALSALALFPILPHLASAASRLRFNEVNIFSDSGVVVKANNRMSIDQNAWWSKIIHNRRIGYAKEYLVHFFDNLDPRFLFIRGDGNPKFSIQDVGQLYVIELPFLVLGLFWLFRTHRTIAWLAIFWIASAIIPAATARETPHALRTENSLPMWQFFIASGILCAIEKIKKQQKTWLTLLVVVLYVGNFSFYIHNYYNHYATEYSGEWQWGYREAIQYATNVKYQYDNVIVDDIIGRPYIYTLFYERYDPKKFQDSVNSSVDGAGFFHIKSFDQYQFVDRRPAFDEHVLYILRPNFVPEYANVLDTIHLLNGSPILVIFDIIHVPKKS